MAQLKRGIAPDLLVSQVRNTMPYLFEDQHSFTGFPPAAIVRDFARDVNTALSHFEYYRLCLSAHYLTVATPVPTDVDNQIRQTLWAPKLPVEDALAMAALVRESRGWDFKLVTERYACGVGDYVKDALSGHLGEWFTVASGAYCALGKYSEQEARIVREALLSDISDETNRHSEVFGSLWRANDGVGSLKASAAIAHNFGDLDRVMDMWALPASDPLRTSFYKLAAEPFDQNGKLRHLGRLWVAGELYKSMIDGSSMALENHRHFALRKPRSLRRSRELLITTGPFLDDWGAKVAQSLSDHPDDLVEVVLALVHGKERLPLAVGYVRALLGIESHGNLPPKALLAMHDCFRSDVRSKQARARFEDKWRTQALGLMDEIPTTASTRKAR